ncbi:MAG: TRAP transporter small permease subunit [Paracoccaceae bacterium]
MTELAARPRAVSVLNFQLGNSLMLSLVSALHRTSRVFVWIGGILILGAAFLVTVEVVLRKVANYSIGGADELSGYAFAVATSLGFAYALFERAHIRVDALLVVLPRSLRIALSFFGLALLIGFAAIIGWQAWALVGDTLQYGSRSITPMRTPLALPQIPWLIGWAFLIVCGIVLFIAALWTLLKGDPAQTERMIGVKTLDEQIQDETV